MKRSRENAFTKQQGDNTENPGFTHSPTSPFKEFQPILPAIEAGITLGLQKLEEDILLPKGEKWDKTSYHDTVEKVKYLLLDNISKIPPMSFITLDFIQAIATGIYDGFRNRDSLEDPSVINKIATAATQIVHGRAHTPATIIETARTQAIIPTSALAETTFYNNLPKSTLDSDSSKSFSYSNEKRFNSDEEIEVESSSQESSSEERSSASDGLLDYSYDAFMSEESSDAPHSFIEERFPAVKLYTRNQAGELIGCTPTPVTLTQTPHGAFVKRAHARSVEESRQAPGQTRGR